MKKITIGVLAHVDSGKTTLSESLLYEAGEIKNLGRVDHKSAHLDTNEIEKDRGITIFSKQAVINYKDAVFYLLDTPGHVDFSSETERTLSVIDYAILLVSGSDGVQSHTETLYNLLKIYNVPTFIFVNKTDLVSFDREKILTELYQKIGDGCIDFNNKEELYERIALTSEEALVEFDESGIVEEETIKEGILKREIFPCFFGSALKCEGVKEFLDSIYTYTNQKKDIGNFGGRVFKIAEDDKGQKLTYIKVTGGTLNVRTQITHNGTSEKVNEIRVYSGEKYKNISVAASGDVCALTGLNLSYLGEGLGFENDSEKLSVKPFFTYSVKIGPDVEFHKVLSALRVIEKEESNLNVNVNERINEITVQVMGEIQLEVLKRIMADRFSLLIDFENGSIIYKETIKNEVTGVGHYEPLKHYAEVHLLMEPGKAGSGITISSSCSEDVLSKNWQRLILKHIEEKTHLGVLTGSTVTDIKITLINGRAHLKHTEGGDFRQATYRAIRQGLMQAESVLLEPWYNFSLDIPMENTGKALTDLQQMGAVVDVPENLGELTKIKGSAPVSKIINYHKEVISYTHGKGKLNCVFKGYEPCNEQDEIINKINYNPDEDIENTAGSVFCSHGSGFFVKWDEVYNYMHIPVAREKKEEEEIRVRNYKKLICDEEELLKIFENTYGKIKRKELKPMRRVNENTSYKENKKKEEKKETCLLIDGYNIIYSWDDFKEIARDSLEDARILFVDKICNYQIMKENNVIIVFDAYKVKGGIRTVEKVHGVTIVYTKEAETADSYIEKASLDLSKKYRVRVATSDSLEQMIIFGHGAERISAREFEREVKETEDKIKEIIDEYKKNEPKTNLTIEN